MNKKFFFSYIKGIDGIRAVAVIAVILYHLNPKFLAGGFTGVDVFFVISGYVVSSSIYKHYINSTDKSFFKYLVNFYLRRVTRIYPALIFFLFVFIIIVTVFIPESWLSDSIPKTALYSFFGFSNFALLWFNDGYFSPRVEFNFFTHTWSLSVEEQFYIIFPFLLYLQIKYFKYKIVNIFLYLLLFISLGFSIYFSYTDINKAYYLLISRFWELLSGSLLFLYHLKQKEVRYHSLYSLFGSILIILGFFFSTKESFPFPYAFLPVIGTLFLIHSLVSSYDFDKDSIVKFFENSLLVKIGLISYSLYLWHWGIFTFFRWTIGLDTLLKILIAITLTFLLAYLSYKYVEKPIRKYRYSFKNKDFFLLLAGLVVIFSSYKLGMYIFENQKYITISIVEKNRKIWYPYEIIEKKSQKKEHFKKLFVVGDSHTGAYSTMLSMVEKRYNIKVIKIYTGYCTMGNLLVPGMYRNDFCKKQTKSIFERLEKESKPGDILFLASLRMNRLCDQWKVFSKERVFKARYSEEAKINRKKAYDEAVEILDFAKRLKLLVLIDAPKPVFKSPTFRCVDWYDKNNPVCKYGFSISKKFLLDYRKPVIDSLNKLKKDFKNLTVWDPFPILCRDKKYCYSYKNDLPLFFDGDHLSGYGNKVLFSSFISQILTSNTK